MYKGIHYLNLERFVYIIMNIIEVCLTVTNWHIHCIYVKKKMADMKYAFEFYFVYPLQSYQC